MERKEQGEGKIGDMEGGGEGERKRGGSRGEGAWEWWYMCEGMRNKVCLSPPNRMLEGS